MARRIRSHGTRQRLRRGCDADDCDPRAGRVGLAGHEDVRDERTKYGKERQAFGKKIALFQAIQWKLAAMATEIDAARLLTYRAAHLEDLGRRHTSESSVAKLFA